MIVFHITVKGIWEVLLESMFKGGDRDRGQRIRSGNLSSTHQRTSLFPEQCPFIIRSLKAEELLL